MPFKTKNTFFNYLGQGGKEESYVEVGGVGLMSPSIMRILDQTQVNKSGGKGTHCPAHQSYNIFAKL